MDNRHRIPSTRGCVDTPMLPCSLLLSDRLSPTLVTLHLSTPTNWQTHIQCLAMPSRCPRHQSINPTREAIHIFSHNNLSSWTADPQNQTWEERTRTPHIHTDIPAVCVQSVSKLKSPPPWFSSAPPSSQMSWSSGCLHSELHTAHLFPTMPTTVCVSARNGRSVGQRQLSAPWTALTLQGRQLLCTLLPNGWRHDPRDFRLSYRTIVVPVGIIVYSNTVHTRVHFLDWYVNYCDCHCCP